MTQVFLQPMGGDGESHYAETMARPVPIARMQPSLSSEDLSALETESGGDGFPTWGMTPGVNGANIPTWNAMGKGDIVLFSRSGQVFASGTVIHKTRNEHLAASLWGRDRKGETWEFIFYLRDVFPRAIRIEDFNLAAGYSPSFVARGCIRLNPTASDGVLARFPELRVGYNLEQAMRAWEQEADSSEIARIDQLHEQSRSMFSEIFGSSEALATLQPDRFFEFFNLVDAHATWRGLGIFRFNLPFPKKPNTTSGQRLSEDIGAFREALTTLFYGAGDLAQRVDSMLAGPRVRTYINGQLAIPSALLTFADPESHAGVQRMDLKRKKLRAAGAMPDLKTDASIGEEFVALEDALANLPTKHGRSWSWAMRFGFFFSDAFKKLEGEDAEIPRAYFILSQKADEASEFQDTEGFQYHFDSNVSGRMPLLEAGAGRFVYYRPGSASDGTAKTFFGYGEIAHLETIGTQSGGTEDYIAHLSNCETFPRPVSKDEFQPQGWNPQHSISKVSQTDFEELLRRGRGASVSPHGEFDMDWLRQRTMWPREDLEQLVEAIHRTQVVLSGPPGTGKTWVAKAIAQHLTGDDRERFRIVQFHPSYGYEEFIEGLRPDWDPQAGGMVFRPVPGIVIRMSQWTEAKQENHYLIMDEMNRANLPRVFGELMYLFEYRDPKDAIQLQYSPSDQDETSLFHVPDKLRFIGTMNTADRSIRSIDTALRRRFELFECNPSQEILEEWYSRPGKNNQVAGLIEGFNLLNVKLLENYDRHHTVGHTFFMKDRMDMAKLRRIWQRQIEPLLEEYFFDRLDLLDEFAFESFWPV